MMSVLITGASTGIGRATVAHLVRNGFHVWATVRADADDHELRAAHGDAVSVLRMDLTDHDSITAAGAVVCAAGPLHGVVNNAGVALPGPLEHVPMQVFRRQIEINLVAQLAVTQAMLPALRLAKERGERARIVMIGSIGGRIAGPMLGGYHSSKFGLVGLSDSLRAELTPSGIPVVMIEPGAIATPIWRRGRSAGDEVTRHLTAGARNRYAKQIEASQANAARSAESGLPPARVARVIHEALTARSPRARYLVGPDARAAATLTRLSMRLTRRLVAARA
ncbi:SDR family NAD(P)-dependent oxidoreductase [Dactylosporangium vinaceum]|uniref:SDR family NAD(P)-dependent oxidoreductase n=1 Tax=Dactylosporangium vinaceum TaxID=53362 RepID=A0ABV5M9P0_9ACTN|nr:SDR family NAD(P)-dependent oxidoreductase [Dactylosporangium vinaceum]UAC00098.1 SDR family NAD(P)-dependent oxidoreductase [Dactylosporangium vinaceum]